MNTDLKNFYQNKKVFLTGHTGFKGSWLSLLLTELGAKVIGYSLTPEHNENLFSLAAVEEVIYSNIISDIRDFKQLQETLQISNPDIIFHLAAQPLVKASYQDPIYNYQTNVIGTVNLLEAAKSISSLKSVINITTDKCYENKEWYWSYRENDSLGGHDPYSASKACSEIVTSSYRKSFFEGKNIGLASARAGNVIGGGDFSNDRIIPDIFRAIQNNQQVVLRNPNAVRPWQHVLDVLHGYLLLGKKLYNNPIEFAESFNFSPMDNREIIVEDITKQFIQSLGKGDYLIDKSMATVHEANMLKLDSSKAVKKLDWSPKYGVIEAIQQTANWYKSYLKGADVVQLCQKEIINFINERI